MPQIYLTVIIYMLNIIHKHIVNEEASRITPFLTRWKVKLKVTLLQALRLCTGRTAHRGRRGIALLFHKHNNRKR
jgi:hypothetical protein